MFVSKIILMFEVFPSGLIYTPLLPHRLAKVARGSRVNKCEMCWQIASSKPSWRNMASVWAMIGKGDFEHFLIEIVASCYCMLFQCVCIYLFIYLILSNGKANSTECNLFMFLLASHVGSTC